MKLVASAFSAASPVSRPRLPVFLAELTGIHPTTQGLVVQGAMLAVFLLGALYVFAWQPARKRRRLTFGIRLHVIVRETNEEAWAAADAR